MEGEVFCVSVEKIRSLILDVLSLRQVVGIQVETQVGSCA